MLISSSRFLFWDPYRVALHGSQLKILFILYWPLMQPLCKHRRFGLLGHQYSPGVLSLGTVS